MTFILLPYFNDISAKTFSVFILLFNPDFGLFVLLPFVVGLLAGYYPAFFLSSFRPIEVLKGKFNAGFKRSNLRNLLVTFQFVTSLVLVIGTIIVYQQLNYIQTKKLGFDKDQVLIIDGTGALATNTDVFKNEIAQIAGVKSASTRGFYPLQALPVTIIRFLKEAVMDMKNGFNMQVWRIDYDYVPTLGMEIIKGPKFFKIIRFRFFRPHYQRNYRQTAGLQRPHRQKNLHLQRSVCRSG